MLVRLFSLAVLFFLTIIGLNWLLSVDDLSKCDKKPSDKSGCQVVDAIVAISGGDTAARTLRAVDLYQNGWAKVLIFSGAAVDKQGPSNAYVMRELAVSKGVDEKDIIIDEYAETTKQNAQNVQNILDERGDKSYILVTSGYHQRRASLEFNKVVNDADLINAPVLNDKDWSSFWWASLRGWSLAIDETAKITMFYILGFWR